MRVIDLGPGGANDINDAGQVVGESLVATGGKLPLAGTVLSRFPPEDSEVAPGFGTIRVVGRSLLRMGQDGAEDDEDETED